jgi:hypothetical protein
MKLAIHFISEQTALPSLQTILELFKIMSNLWKQFKNIFSKTEESFRTSSAQTIEAISENSQEPTIKKLKRQISYRKDPKFRENCSSAE